MPDFYGNPVASDYYYSQYPAQSPFSYDGAAAAGYQVSATAADAARAVLAPVVGFTQGLFHGRAILAVLLIGGALYLTSRD